MDVNNSSQIKTNIYNKHIYICKHIESTEKPFYRRITYSPGEKNKNKRKVNLKTTHT